jgi:hypothetical protein
VARPNPQAFFGVLAALSGEVSADAFVCCWLLSVTCATLSKRDKALRAGPQRPGMREEST